MMVSLPTIAWLDVQLRATLAAYARERGEPVERVAADLIESELRRRKVPAAAITDLAKPTAQQTQRALELAQLEVTLGGDKMSARAMLLGMPALKSGRKRRR
jgi:hypothetical protein